MRLLRKYKRIISLSLLVVFINTMSPSWLFANNGGPKQPEVQKFSPIGTTKMVDPFTGNFSYNIPLMDVGGYPINISYSSDHATNEDASWVGLGWSLGVGNVDRTVRGLPDDFSGDKMEVTANRKVNRTFGINTGATIEFFGIDFETIGLNVGASVGVYHNNYTGFGNVIGVNGGLSLKFAGQGSNPHAVGLGVNALSHSSNGLTVTPSLNFSHSGEQQGYNAKGRSIALGMPWNSQLGFRQLTVTGSVNETHYPGNGSSYSIQGSSASASYSFADPTSWPSVTKPMSSLSASGRLTVGGELFGQHVNGSVEAYFTTQGYMDHIFGPNQSSSVYQKYFRPQNSFEDDPLWKDALEIASGPFTGNATLVYPSYGYLYSHDAKDAKEVMYDYNREKDGPFDANRKYLPIPVFTHDIYNVTGQGTGASFRPFRNDVGILHNPKTNSTSASLDVSLPELGAGNAVHVGFDFSVAETKDVSTKWTDENGFNNLMRFRGEDVTPGQTYQPYYFKAAGEMTSDFSTQLFNDLGGFDPISFDVEAGGAVGKNLRVNEDGFSDEKFQRVNTPLVREFDQPTSQHISFLNATEAKNFAVEKPIYVYKEGVFEMDEYGRYVPESAIDRLERGPGHHMSEITVTNPGGVRYIYGIPSYNTLQKEVSFALECNDAIKYYKDDYTTGLTKYDHGDDNSIDNDKGFDNSFEETVTPPYAHSFLLNAILSDDYVDIGNDGPSDDDIGSYTKFNYALTNKENNWRAPVERDMASYFEGFNSHPHDGRGSYSYGTRELWYLHSIETKTHVAEFVLGNRKDGVGVNGERGGLDESDRMKKLVRIDLYAKADKLKEVKSNGVYTAIPIKSVHFVYDYSLCKGVNTSIASSDQSEDSGKLTLKKIFFSFQNSFKARLSPYEFEYGYDDPAYNPDWDFYTSDSWGTYKAHINKGDNGEDGQTELSNLDFPYTEQNKATADINAAVWNLTKITLPSGGIINVEYEADDYAFVQEKNAAQLFEIVGFGNDSDLGEIPSGNKDQVGDVVIFKLAEPVSGITDEEARALIADQYLKDLVTQNQFCYLKPSVAFPANIDASLSTSTDDDDITWDYVPSYARLDINHADPYGVLFNGGVAEYGYVRLKKEDDGDGGTINAITKWSIGLAKMNMPWYFNDDDRGGAGCDDIGFDNIMEAVEEIGKAYSVVGALAQHTYSNLKSDSDLGKIVNLRKSFIRLYNPSGFKYGGGSRVKRVTVNDDWASMTGDTQNLTTVRGQEYSYLTADSISSGVASWEPVVGGEENPYRLPLFVKEDRLGVPDQTYFLEGPMGVSFYPSPVVGYSRVTTRDINGIVDPSGNIDYEYSKTGYSVSEFFTAKDFPTKTRQTELNGSSMNELGNFVASIFEFNVFDYKTVSQGFAVELNDMHGKAKRMQVFPESSEVSNGPISSVEYFYKMDADGNLDNTAKVLNRSAISARNGFIEDRMIGIDYEVVAEMNEHESSTIIVKTQGNLETFIVGIFPIIIPPIYPSFAASNLQLRTAAISKVIKRTGLLERVVSQDLGKYNEATNEMYDAESGQVILSSTLNQFGDRVYAFNYPAHFGYDGMGPAYKTMGEAVETPSVDVIEGLPSNFDIQNASDLLAVGDELMMVNLDTTEIAGRTEYHKGWVSNIDEDEVYIIDEEGYSLPTSKGGGRYILKVIRSGRRNLHDSSMGALVTMQNPVIPDPANPGEYTLSFDKILDANAIEYDNKWRILCDCDDSLPPIIVRGAK